MRQLTVKERAKVKRLSKGFSMQCIARKYNWTTEQMELNFITFLYSGTKDNIIVFMEKLAAKEMPPVSNTLKC